MPYKILPIQAAIDGVPVNLLDASADLGATPRADLLDGYFPANVARRHRRLDLHLLADAGRLHHPADRGELAVLHRPRLSIRTRVPRAVFRSPPPSQSFRSSSWASTTDARQTRVGRSMRSDAPPRSVRPHRRCYRRASSSCTARRSALIFLFAFSTEERTYQWPPPGLDAAVVCGRAWGRADVWRALDAVGAGRRLRSRRLIAMILGTMVRGRRLGTQFFGREADIAAGDPAHRAARHHHRHFAALRLQPGWKSRSRFWTITVSGARDLLHRRRLQQRRRAGSGASMARWWKRRWDLGANGFETFRHVMPSQSWHGAARGRHARLCAEL